ncbi:transmembrane TMPIT-like protein [Chloropicon primus]|uniref:Transmembrane TMPIT-like protein n=1 Tax=Chloropicon primus TaxID=1764295 RepID=A0A5B8MNA3_9CHLO|nr:transmembrane TMPIT-like protein [Chloropicon primus]UPQ99992.1 transmembrane TMPIT-like protein [Chloropicon primus]|mmetsp:Transcript_8393/g.23990  ORF Transcript_8393/g.23990 Transcript_8393/m.23990 type:complete len:376 (+) Transcript_8393:189-1316(+)|eukprot:QDZ20780.1 transmembrane TMPIT-like protein [Chloropicon primus]
MTLSPEAVSPAELVNRCRVLSERVAQHNRRMKADEQALGSEIDTAYRELRSQIESSRDSGTGEDEGLEQLLLAKKIYEGQGPGGDLRIMSSTTKKTPIMLKYLLGKETAGVLIRFDQRLKLKQEYFKFRHAAALIFTIVPLILGFGLRRATQMEAMGEQGSLSPPLWVATQAYAAWLVYFYVSLALRENILVMNGSDIRAWWIHHHYIMVLFTLVLMTLPTESKAFKIFSEKFIFFNVLQGLIMMFQNKYQSRRLYRQIALGRNKTMDVVSTESSPGKGHLLVLYPALFAMQALQFAVAIDAILYSANDFFSEVGWLDNVPSSTDLRSSRGVFVCGVLFMILALGNLLSTLATIFSKAKKSSRRNAKSSSNKKSR